MSLNKVALNALNALVTLALSFGTAQADNAVYQITAVKGRAMVELPNGPRQMARPGMRVGNGSRIIVLEKSLVTGFDLQNKCRVDYHARVRSKIIRGRLCPKAASVPRRPVVVKPPIASGGGIAPLAGGSVGLGAAGGATVILPVLGLAGLGLLAYEANKSD